MSSALKRSPKPKKLSLANLFAAPITKSPSKFDPDINVLKSKIRSESDPDRLASLFLSSSSNPQFHEDRTIYKISVQKLSASKRPDLIERILEPQKSDPSLPRTEGFLTRIMMLYSDAGMVAHAERTFHFIRRMGFKHTQHTLCALLSVYLRNKKYDMLLKTFYRVPKQNDLKPGVTAYNIVMQGMCEKGDTECAQKLFDEMENPDFVSYTTLLTGYIKNGDNDSWEHVLKNMNECGFKGGATMLNVRIKGLCQSGRAVEAEELLNTMRVDNVRANRNSYNMVIEGFCKEGNLRKAMMVYERMKKEKKEREEEDESGVSPNFDTYVMLVKSLVENDKFSVALEMVEEFFDKKRAPPLSAVKGLIEGLKKECRVDEAKHVVAKMNKVVRVDAMDAWKSIERGICLV